MFIAMIADFKNKQKKGPWSKLLFALGGVLILLVFVVLVIANIKVYNKRKELATQVDNLKNKIEAIQQKNEDLKKGISKSNDDAYIEKVAREDLDLQKEGETVISFIKAPNQQSSNNREKRNILQAWLWWASSGWDWLKNSFK